MFVVLLLFLSFAEQATKCAKCQSDKAETPDSMHADLLACDITTGRHNSVPHVRNNQQWHQMKVKHSITEGK